MNLTTLSRPIQNFITSRSDGINWIKKGDSTRGQRYITQCKEKIIPEGKVKSRFVKAGSLILSNSMSFGYPYILKIDGCIHDGWLAISDFEKDLFVEFAYFLLLSPYCRSSFTINAAGAVVKNLNIEKVEKLYIPLPPLAEQRRIVARLNELLPLVEEYGKSQSALHVLETELPGKLRASLLQQAIMGKLVPQLDDEPAVDIDAEEPEEVPFAIPEKWKWISLGDAVAYGNAEQVAGSSISKEAWVLDLEDIQKNLGILLQKKRNVTSTSNKSRFFKENVLYSKLRPYLNKVIVADEDGYCTTEIIPINPRSNGYKIDAEYLKTYLMSPYFVHYANEQSYGVKMPRLGTKDAKLAPFPFPPIAEQRRIVARLNEIFPFFDTMVKY